MGKRTLVGIAAGLLAAALVVGVASAAYKVGRSGERETVTVRDGEAVRVIDGHWDRGPGFGFLVFPLLVTGIVLLAVSRRGHGGPGWGCGPGPDAAFADWHRRAHEQQGAASPPAGPPSPPGR